VPEFINYLTHSHKKGYMKNNKVCIVTGASRGLGRGIALVLAQEEGCTVYATARNEEALKALAEEALLEPKAAL
jgi:NAD(P)-dependent dehydrogenase (short-subunit alcohol dehydrogenase family)